MQVSWAHAQPFTDLKAKPTLAVYPIQMPHVQLHTSLA